MREFFEIISKHWVMFLIIVISMLLALDSICTTIQNIIIERTRIKYEDNEDDEPIDY